MKIKTPCLDCTKREVGCHGKCEEYKVYKELVEEVKRARSEENKKQFNYKYVHWEEK